MKPSTKPTTKARTYTLPERAQPIRISNGAETKTLQNYLPDLPHLSEARKAASKAPSLISGKRVYPAGDPA